MIDENDDKKKYQNTKIILLWNTNVEWKGKKILN